MARLHGAEARGQVSLFYFDASGVSLTPVIPYAWQPRGQTRELPSRHGGRINLVGFIGRREAGYLQRIEGPLDSAGVIRALDAFAEHRKGQGLTLVVLDNAPIHHSHAVYERLDDWLACGVGLHFLPPYSPELNLIERLWRMLKYAWLPLSAYHSAEALREAVDEIIANYGTKYRLTFA